MRLTKAIILVSALFVLGLIHTGYVYSQDNQTKEKMVVDEELDEELRWLKAETYVITASRVMEEINKAPASITVITDRQIRQMGAKHLNDVLKRIVPSLYSRRYFLNGIYFPHARGGNSVLTMINNHPIYDSYQQGVGLYAYDTLNVENIKRIEVIRGPGSALYGANAYDGVINIITKDASDIDGVEFTGRGGSWDTQQYNMLFGKTLRELEIVFNFNYFKTNGHRAFVKEDLYTPIDQLTVPLGFPPASLAPGHTKADDEKYDVALNLKFKGLTFDGRYVDREWDRPFANVPVLTEKLYMFNEDYFLNLSYETAIRDGIDLSGKVYRHRMEPAGDWQEWPSGGITWIQNPMPPPDATIYIWPEGFLHKWSRKDSCTGIEIQTHYQINNSNTIIAGATYEKQKIYDGEDWRNFLETDLTAPDGGAVYIPLSSVQEIPSDLDWERTFKAVFLEDIWDITDDIRLTSGLRYDHYSDFGGHVSPRIGLTWEYMKGFDLKLLYGHAFRAPGKGEIDLSVPGSTLDPETVDTYEISLGAEFTTSFSSRLTFYQKDEKNLIEHTTAFPFYFVNRGTKHWQGVEVEVKYDFGRGSYLAGNYSYSNTSRRHDLPQHLGKLISNIRLSRHLNAYADCYYVGGMSRMPGDLRDDTSSYTYVNVTLIAKKFLKNFEGLELKGSVYNLFDEDFAYWVEDISYGWPRPGRSYLLELKYSL